MMIASEFFKNLPMKVSDDPIIFGELGGATLAAPKSFWDCPEEIRGEVINGCGPGGFGDFLVPDTVYGMSIKAACMIHDWCFLVFNDEAGFKLSNQLFLDNMARINKAKTKFAPLWWLRSRRIRKYYLAVRDIGRLFFYDAHIDVYGTGMVYA